MKSTILFAFLMAAGHLIGQELYFPPSFDSEWEEIAPSELDWCEDHMTATEAYLESTNTKAFIILKDGKMAMESYFGDHDVDAQWYWASAGKSMVAALTGILQEEGLVDINKPSATYLGEGWSECAETEGDITVAHHLSLTTGLDYTVEDENCTLPECFTCLNEAGEEWYYHNATYRLVPQMLESATGQSLTQITNQRIASKIGYLGGWVVSDQTTLYFSTARGMARFGLMMLARGQWDGETIIDDMDYFDAMITPSQQINASYGYLWWLNAGDSFRLPGSVFTFSGKLVPDAPDDLYAAIGKNGQICMVVPSQQLVIIRMGDNPEESLVPISYVRDIWSQYESLPCTNTVEDHIEMDFDISPRLTDQYLYLSANHKFDALDILDRSGRVVMRVGEASMLDVGILRAGIYFARIQRGKQVWTKRFVKL